MKKLTLSLAVLLALSLTFMSCIFEDNTMYELTTDDVSDSWLRGVKWSGTQSITISGDTSQAGATASGDIDIDHQEFSPAAIKTIINSDGKQTTFLGVTSTTKATVKSNRSRTKLWMEEIVTTSGWGLESKTTSITDLVKD